MTPVNFNTAFVAEDNIVELRCHWYFSGAVPVAATLKVTVCPAKATRLVGCFVIWGAVLPGGATVTVNERVMMPFVFWPLLTMTEMIEVPTAPTAGVKLKMPVVFGNV